MGTTSRVNSKEKTPERMMRSRSISKSSSPTSSLLQKSSKQYDIDNNSDEDELPDSQLEDSQLEPKSQRRLRSWIWNHGFLSEDEEFWRCGLCIERTVEFKIRSTTHAGSHLRKLHNIGKLQQGNSKTHAKKHNDINNSTSNNTMSTFFNRSKSVPFKEHQFKSYLINWILCNRIAFHQVETESFRKLIECLRSEAINVLPKSANTLRKWSMLRFEAARTSVKYALSIAKSKIHISCDLWSSSNGHAFLGIVAYWWDMDNTIKSALLALPKLSGIHSGENIAFTIVEILDFYAIKDKLGYFMLDNATNNDTAVQAVTEELAKRGIYRDLSNDESRLRCTGHILNLVVKALLFGNNSDALEMDEVDFKTWKKVGALGKLHNIVRFIRASPQR
jgi:hypothetical protein